MPLPRTDSVPGYEIISELGRGGMGVVYKARQIKLNRLTALKMVLAGLYAGNADLARFRTEAEAVARLQHPNIIQIYELGEHNGLPYCSLEFCPGGSLENRLSGKPLPALEAAALVETLARAINVTHTKGIVHRDLKPANVLLAEDGTPKITDFGLAKMLGEAGQTASGAILGTPSYMAPEQAGGKSRQIGPATDVYALGAILYECLTGRPPFQAGTTLDTLLQVVADEPIPPSHLQPEIPKDLESMCLKCLHKEPTRRYASALELAQDLSRFRAGQTSRPRPVHFGEPSWSWCRRKPRLVGLGAAAAVLLLACAAIMAYLAVRAGGKHEPPAPTLQLPSKSVQILLLPREEKAIPGSHASVWVRLGHITHEQALLSVVAADQSYLVEPMSISQGDTIDFFVEGKQYTIHVRELHRSRIGRDFARITVEQTPGRNP
jgi:serine/threonine protein kinase